MGASGQKYRPSGVHNNSKFGHSVWASGGWGPLVGWDEVGVLISSISEPFRAKILARELG